jgi:hypothetical protein
MENKTTYSARISFVIFFFIILFVLTSYSISQDNIVVNGPMKVTSSTEYGATTTLNKDSGFFVTINYSRYGEIKSSIGLAPEEGLEEIPGDAFVIGSTDGNVWTDPLVIENAAPTGSIYIKTTGKVGIATTNPKYDLDVSGDIRATGSVYYGGTSGSYNGAAYQKPDYVFEKGYRVMSTKEVADFLTSERHLPWLTSAEQEERENKKSVDMTRMAFETLETAENLQLQIIALQNILIDQQKQIEWLKSQVTSAQH